MAQKYPDKLVKKIVEEDTDHQYSLLFIESQGKKNPLTGKTMKRKMTLCHIECGHTYEVDIYEFIEGKRRCGKCKGKKLRTHFVESLESIKEKTELLTEGEYSFADTIYTNSKTKHSFLHNTCGTVFEKKWEKFKGTPKQEGQRCPECTRIGMESGASRYVRDIFDTLGVIYITEIHFADCINPDTSKTLPFDYYLPDINTLIEIDGEQHERNSFSKYASDGIFKRDRIKDVYAEENGIKLVRIPAKKWSQLPEILHAILSKDLLKSLLLEEVKAIPHSSHPDRINKDLLKIHNGGYRLHDTYYFGVDQPHTFIHHACGTLFKKTLSNLRIEEMPCTHCKKKVREKKQHDTCNKKMIKKTQGRYSLDGNHIGRTKDNKRLVHCHACSQSWYSSTSNILSNNGGCSSCNKKKRARTE